MELVSSTHLKTHLHTLHHLPLSDWTFPFRWQNLTVQILENMISKSDDSCFLTGSSLGIGMSSLLRFYKLNIGITEYSTKCPLTSPPLLLCLVLTLSNSMMLSSCVEMMSSISDAADWPEATDYGWERWVERDLPLHCFDASMSSSVFSFSSSNCLPGSDEPSLKTIHFFCFVFGILTLWAFELLSCVAFSFAFCTGLQVSTGIEAEVAGGTSIVV